MNKLLLLIVMSGVVGCQSTDSTMESTSVYGVPVASHMHSTSQKIAFEKYSEELSNPKGCNVLGTTAYCNTEENADRLSDLINKYTNTLKQYKSAPLLSKAE